MTASKIESWIRAGYTILGTEGIDGLKIERLARVLGQNKSCFYYYFGGMKTYMKSLLHHHVGLAKDIAAEIANCETIDPDLLLLIVKHKAFFLADSEMIMRSKSASADECAEAVAIINQELLPLWRRNTDLPNDAGVATAYLNIIRHFLYSRISSENISYEFLHNLVVHTEYVLAQVSHEKRMSTQSTRTLY